jgi:hypothetical protein
VQAFMDGLHAGCFVAAGVTLVASALVMALLPARPELAQVPQNVR